MLRYTHDPHSICQYTLRKTCTTVQCVYTILKEIIVRSALCIYELSDEAVLVLCGKYFVYQHHKTHTQYISKSFYVFEYKFIRFEYSSHSADC